MQAAAASSASAYTFQAAPKALQAQRSKYRDPNAKPDPKNIMHDRRVVRGNTYAAQIETATMAAQQLAKTQTQKKVSTMGRQEFVDAPRAVTPDPVPGRKHMEIQTDNYLEELTDKPHEEDASTQTDAVMDRPSPVLFIPQPSGESKETQIYEGELFDFDLEVEPILEVLVGKTVDQSLMEVLEEQELKAIRAQQEAFEQRRAVEMAEAQRLEAAEKRRLEEAHRRKQQEEARLKKEKEVASKLAARTVAKEYLSGLQDSVFSRLQKAGLFHDPLEQEVQNHFMPWLTDQVATQLQTIQAGRQLVENLLASAVGEQVNQLRLAVEAAQAKKAEEDRIAREKEEAIRLAAEEEARKKAEEAAAAAAAAAEASVESSEAPADS